MQENIASELSEQHELTLEQLERVRDKMESELTQLEMDSLNREN